MILLYYAVARAYEPIHVSAKFDTLAWGRCDIFEVEVWASNAYEQSFGATLQINIVGMSGQSYMAQAARGVG